MDFTQISQGYKYLLVMIDTFTGWIEGFPTQTEKADEVVKKKHKKLLHEIILRFGLPRSFQIDNGTSFTFKVTQGGLEGIGHCLLSPLCLEASVFMKRERANQFLKSVIKRKTQETSLGWNEALPIALLLPIHPSCL